MPLTGTGASKSWSKFEPFYERTSADATFSVKIVLRDVDKWNAALNISNEVREAYSRLFKQVVFDVHRYLIRVTPLDTGRLRAGWTGVLEKYNEDYTAAFMDTSLIDLKRDRVDQALVALGKSESTYIDEKDRVMVSNSVPYGQFVEYGTSKMMGQHFTLRALYKAESLMRSAFGDWIQECKSAGRFVEPKTSNKGATA